MAKSRNKVVVSDILPVKSERVALMIKELASGPKRARDLAKVAGIESKQVYPMLKAYMEKGWIEVTKINNINLYSLTEKFRSIIRSIGNTFERVLKNAEKKLGRKLDNDEIEVLRALYEAKTYIYGEPDGGFAMRIYNMLKGKVKLYKIEEILREFFVNRIIFAYQRRSGQILKIKLDNSLFD